MKSDVTGFLKPEPGSVGTAIFLLVMALAIIPACAPDEGEERPETPDSADVRPDVIFSTADDQPLHMYIESRGIVEAGREIVIRPRISGFLETSALEDGAYVQQGDTLFSFLDEEWRYQLRQAENEVESARVDYDIERRQRQRRNGGNDSDDMSDDRMLRNVTGLAQAELDLERAKMDLSYAVITAPFSGYVSAPERISSGAFISSGLELGRLIDDETVLVRLDVLEAELNLLEKGMTVEVTSPAGDRKEGSIRALSPVVDEDRKTGQVILEVDNYDRNLRPGMTVEGRVRVRSHNGMARIPRAAILERDGGRTLVFKLNDQTVEWVYVEPEFMNSQWAIINHEEITPGDTLAVDRHFALSHQQNVRPRMAGDPYRIEPEWMD
ncbi:MAG: efflux RND transporter periplasmic adaptor subunit [Balneolaceae bacterium]